MPGLEVLINAAGRGYVRTLAMTRVTHANVAAAARRPGCRMVVNVCRRRVYRRDGIFPYAGSRRVRGAVRGFGRAGARDGD